MTNNTHVTNLTLSDIKVDPECQARAAMDDTTIDEYAEVMKEKGYDRFPAVVVYHDGTDYWLSDGFHRYAAAEKAGLPSINARIHQGSRRDAILNSVGTNATHGLRRSNEDKRRAVAMLLGDPEWVRWSDAKIAQHCRVSDRFVAKQRKNTPNRSESDARVYIHPKSGKTTTMNTAKIGKRDGLDEVLSVEPDRDVQPDQTWLARPDTGTAKEDTVDDIADDERGPVSDLTSGTEEVELQELLSAWSRASEEVQQQFLTSIGVSPTPQDDEGSGLAETEHRQQPEPSHEPTSPQKPSYAVESSQRPEPSHDAGPHAANLSVSELVEMWNGYRGHTKTYGRNWVVAGCPDGALPEEHPTFTDKLKPFRAAVSAAPEEVREQFLALTQAA